MDETGQMMNVRHGTHAVVTGCWPVFMQRWLGSWVTSDLIVLQLISNLARILIFNLVLAIDITYCMFRL